MRLAKDSDIAMKRAGWRASERAIILLKCIGADDGRIGSRPAPSSLPQGRGIGAFSWG
jgi:hypothetical protein